MSCNCKPQYETCGSKEKSQDKIEVHIHMDCCCKQCSCRQQCGCQKKKCPEVKVVY